MARESVAFSAAFNEGPDVVWYPIQSQDEWSACRVVKQSQNNGPMTLLIKGTEVVVPPEHFDLVYPKLDTANHHLRSVNLASGPASVEAIEEALRNHFCNTRPYTNINDVTLFVNLYRQIEPSIYSQHWIDQYSALNPELPPHIYAAAAKAYKELIDTHNSQAIVLVGETCTGKTSAMRHVLNFLIGTAGCDQDFDVQASALLNLLTPLVSISIDARGGKCSWASTRAAVSVAFTIGADGFMNRCFTSVDFLETERLNGPQDSPQMRFDALYLALKDQSASQWIADYEEFCILGDFLDLSEYDKDGKALKSWLTAIDAFNLDKEVIVRMLCGILLLGNVGFEASGEQASQHGRAQCSEAGVVEQAAKVLGISAAELKEALCDGTVGMSRRRLRQLVEELYRRLVGWVVDETNRCLQTDGTPQGALIKVIEIPARPLAHHSPSGKDSLLLQWLNESVRATAPLAVGMPSLPDAEKPGLACMSLVSELQKAEHHQGDLEDVALERLMTKWAEHQTSWGRVMQQSPDHVVAIRGLLGDEIQHRLSDVFLDSVRGLPLEAARLALGRSEIAAVRELADPRFHQRRSAQDVAARVAAFTEVFGSRGVRPWLVCCLRPNTKLSSTLISKAVMERQVQALMLDRLVRLAGTADRREAQAKPPPTPAVIATQESPTPPGQSSADESPTTTPMQRPPALSGADVQALLAHVDEFLPDLVCVCILGSTSLQDPSSQELIGHLASHLTTVCAQTVVFITGGMKGVQEAFARHCHDGCHLYHILPEGQSSGFDLGVDIHAGRDLEDRKDVFAQVGDIYITVEGGPGVAQEATTAFERGAKVVPLIRSGGASSGKFGFPVGALVRPRYIAESQWNLLADKSAPPHTSARAAAEIVEGLVRRFEEGEAAEAERAALEGQGDDEGSPSWRSSGASHLSVPTVAPSAPIRPSESHSGIPAGLGIKETVAAVKKFLPSAVRICILGSTAFQDPSSEDLVKQIAAQLSLKCFASAVFLTGGLKGVQETFARHCDKNVRLYRMLPQGQSSGSDIGTDIIAGADMEERKQIFAQVGDIYVTVEGGPGVAMEAGIAFQRGAEVVPLIRTGGASSGMFGFPPGALTRPSFVPESYWQAISSKDSPISKSATAAAEIVQGLVSRIGEPATVRASSSKASGVLSLASGFRSSGTSRGPASTAKIITAANMNALPHVDELSDLQDSDASESTDNDEEKSMREAGIFFGAGNSKPVHASARSMAFHEHARLHYGLCQMAAELRAAKSNEAGQKNELDVNKLKLERLRAERDAWNMETKHLEGQVSYLTELMNKPVKARSRAGARAHGT